MTTTVTLAEVKMQALAVALDQRRLPAERASAFARAATASVELREFYGASRQAEAGLWLALAANDAPVIADLHFLLGQVSIWIGDMAKAEDNLLAFLAITEDIVADMDPRLGMARYNLGLVFGQYKRFVDARDCFVAAIPPLLAASLPANAARAHLDAARAEMYLDDLLAAEEHIALAIQILNAHHDAVVETHLLCYQAQLQHLAGDVEESDNSCRAVFQPDRHGVTDQHRGEAAWIMGENALASGRVSEAQLFAELAIKYATQFMYPWLINQAINLRNRVTEVSMRAG